MRGRVEGLNAEFLEEVGEVADMDVLVQVVVHRHDGRVGAVTQTCGALHHHGMLLGRFRIIAPDMLAETVEHLVSPTQDARDIGTYTDMVTGYSLHQDSDQWTISTSQSGWNTTIVNGRTFTGLIYHECTTVSTEIRKNKTLIIIPFYLLWKLRDGGRKRLRLP